MLERMRDFSKSTTMKIVLGVVALSFILYFGSSPFQEREEERLYVAVKVNGEPISTNEFTQVFNRFRETQERQQGWPLDEKQQREVARNVYEALVEKALQEQWAKEIGLGVSDDEVSEQVQSILRRFSGGRPITPQLYLAVLRQVGYRSPEAFESDMREQLLTEKIMNFFSQRTVVSEAQMREYFVRQNRQVKGTLVPFTPEMYLEEVEIEPDQLAQFYEENKERYRQPDRVRFDYIEVTPQDLRDEVEINERRLERFFEQRQQQYATDQMFAVDYVEFNPEDFADQVSVSPEEIEQRYEENPESYRFPEEVKTRYIAVDVQDATGVNAPSQERLQQEYEQYKQEIDKEKVPPLDDPRTGMIVLRRAAEDMLEKAQEKLGAGQVLPAGQFEGLKVIETDFFERGKEIDDTIGYDYFAFSNAAFRLEDGQTSDVIYGRNNLYLISRVGSRQARQKTLDEAREEIAREIRQEKLPEVARQKAEEALTAIREEGLSFEDMAARYGVEIKSSGLFSRNERLPQFGQDQFDFLLTATQLQQGQISEVVEMESGAYILRGAQGRPSEPRTLEEVRSRVEQDYRDFRSVSLAADRAYEYLRILQDNNLSLKELASRPDIPGGSEAVQVQDSGLIAMNEPVEAVPDPNRILNRAAFSIPESTGVLNDVVRLDQPRTEQAQGFYLLQLTERVESHIPDLEQVQEQVMADLKTEMAGQLAKEKADNFVEKLPGAIAEATSPVAFSLAEFAEKQNFEPVETTFFRQMGYVTGIGSTQDSPAFSRTAFALQPGQCSGLIEVDKKSVPEYDFQEPREMLVGYYIFQLLEKKEPDFSQLEQQKEQIREQLAYRWRAQAYESWIEGLKEDARIVPNEEWLDDFVGEDWLEEQVEEGAEKA